MDWLAIWKKKDKQMENIVALAIVGVVALGIVVLFIDFRRRHRGGGL